MRKTESDDRSLGGRVTGETWRVAQLAVDQGSGSDGSRGSGYLIAPGRVLTAAHVVAGASGVRVRLDVGQAAEIDVQADWWWADPAGYEGTDLAVVTIPEDVTAGRVVEAARFGRIGDSAAVLAVEAFGFPLFKLRADPVRQRRVFRDFEQAGGHAPVAANRRQALSPSTWMTHPLVSHYGESRRRGRECREGLSGARARLLELWLNTTPVKAPGG
jgi:hypothetical protein